ncbi:hypothetical protein [Sinobaca sp. H24]
MDERGIETGRKSPNSGEVPIGAVIVKEDVIVGYGYNQRKRNSRRALMLK